MPSIGVGIIAKNSESTIRECVESFIEDVDQCVVVISDTSTDKTEEIVRSMEGVEVHNLKWIDDFSAARNLCFSKLHTDWILWVDADDVVYQAENMRNLVAEAKPELGAIWFPYHYATDEFGNLCFDQETEVLTDKGWYRFDGVPQEAKLATLNSDGYLEYQKPTRYIRTQWDGEMVHLNHSKQLDLLITPKHKLYASIYNGANSYEPYRLIKAEKLLAKHFRMKKNAKWIGENPQFFALPAYSNSWELKLDNGHCVNIGKRSCRRPTIQIEMGLWLEFLGYFISEGSIANKDRRVLISQTSPIGRGQIERCLGQLPFQWKKTQNDFYIDSVQLASYLKQNVKKGARNKRIPNTVKQLSPDLLRILIKSLMFGDGDSETGCNYFTISQQLADDLQEIALKAGWAANISIRHQEGTDVVVYSKKCGVAKFPLYIVSVIHKHLRPRVNNLNRGTAELQIKHYKGIVSCYEVPNNTLYVRRNGKSCWAGNTTLYERERLLRASYGWIWRSRLHETVSPLQECQYARTNDVIFLHRHLAGEGRHDRNFRILEIMHKEAPADKRVWLYLGHQHFAARHWGEAAEWYLKFGSDTGALPLERYQALCYCSKALREAQDSQATDVALMAIELYPSYKDAYLELAHSYLAMGDCDKAIHWAKVSDIKEIIHEPPHIIFINPLEYTFNKFVMLAECHMRKKDTQSAVNYMIEAFKIRPLPAIQEQVDHIKDIQLRSRVADSIKVLAVHLLDNKEIVKLRALLDAVPYWFRDLPDYKQLESGAKHYLSQMENKPEVVEASPTHVIVNLAHSTEPEKLLTELDKKYDRVTLSCPMPSSQSSQINAYSQGDIENLIMSGEGRHIVNLQREQNRIICEYDKNVPQNLNVRILSNIGFEGWTPKTIKDIGCGGSETAAAMTARELATKGCHPIIYAYDTQIWDGVIYRDCAGFHPETLMNCHLFISVRNPDIFNQPIMAKQKWLWIHDIHCGAALTPDVAEQLDAIIVLSQWHANFLKDTYPFLKDAEVIDMDGNKLTYEDRCATIKFHEGTTVSSPPKIAIIGNGIDTERFTSLPKVKRNRFRFAWCSSPDRGLLELLNLWGLIKKELPDAELKIFYGWDYFNSTLWIPEQREFKSQVKKLLNQDGIEWCGRVGQDQLALELSQVDAMLYPPPHTFRETYGIAFLEAQMAGVICFYRKNGALGETIGNRGIPLNMDAVPEQIVSEITKTLLDEDVCDRIRVRAKKYALQRMWARQAEKMLELYRRLDDGKD